MMAQRLKMWTCAFVSSVIFRSSSHPDSLSMHKSSSSVDDNNASEHKVTAWGKAIFSKIVMVQACPLSW